MENKNLTFEPQTFSGMDDSLLQAIGDDLSHRNMNERVVDKVVSANDEEYSNFRLFGIGAETQGQKKRAVKRKGKSDIRKATRAANKEDRKHMSLSERLLNLSQKYNPAAAIPRSSALMATRLNLFGIATKLYPALLTDAELKARNFDLANAVKARHAWEKVKKIWNGLGGGSASLAKSIRKGYDKPIFKTKRAKARKKHETAKFDGDEEYSNFDPYSDVAIAAYISLGVSLLGMVSGAISKSGASKNPYNANSPQANNAIANGSVGAGAPPLTQKQQAQVDNVAKVAADDLRQGKGLDEHVGLQEELNKVEQENNTILGIPKTGFYIGVSLLALGLIGLVVWKIRKK